MGGGARLAACRGRHALFVLLCTIALLAQPASAQSIANLLTWTGDVSNAWTDPANWQAANSSFPVPSAETPVRIVSSKSSRPDVLIPASTPFIVKSLQIDAGMLTLSANASLTVLGNVTITSILYLLKGAQLTVQGGFTATINVSIGVLAMDSAVVQVAAKTTFDSFASIYAMGASVFTSSGGFDADLAQISFVGTAQSPCNSTNTTLTINAVSFWKNVSMNAYHLHFKSTFARSQLIVNPSLQLTYTSIFIVYPVVSATPPTPILSSSLNVLTPVNATVLRDFTAGCSYDPYAASRTSLSGNAGCSSQEQGSLVVLVGGCPGGGAAIPCTLGYTGPNCATPICASGCSGHGSCTSAFPSLPYCTCDPGWRAASDCSVPSCEAYASCSGNHGQCVAAQPLPQCVCTPAWSDPTCATPVCSPPCNARQYCEGAAIPAPQCRCIAGWTGPACNTASSSPCPGGCSGHGTCNEAAHTCACDAQWGGQDCSVPLCASNCSNRGVCQQTHVCVCDSGYSGADCGEALCVGGCDNGGVCVTSAGVTPVCVCTPDWYGNRCELSVYGGKPPTPKSALTFGMIIGISIACLAALLLAVGLYVFRDRLRGALLCSADDDNHYSEFR